MSSSLRRRQITVIVSLISGQSSVCFNSLFRLTRKKHQRSALLSLCEGNPLVTSGFPAQRDINAENVSIWWRHNAIILADFYAGHPSINQKSIRSLSYFKTVILYEIPIRHVSFTSTCLSTFTATCTGSFYWWDLPRFCFTLCYTHILSKHRWCFKAYWVKTG